jgi:heme-degrading monooxygenase HmoA
MFVRTTRFTVKQSSIGQFREIAEGTRDRVSEMDGLLHSYSCVDDSGHGLLVGIWEDEDKAKAGAAQIRAVWASIAAHLEGGPQFTEYRTVIVIK